MANLVFCVLIFYTHVLRRLSNPDMSKWHCITKANHAYVNKQLASRKYLRIEEIKWYRYKILGLFLLTLFKPKEVCLNLTSHSCYTKQWPAVCYQTCQTYFAASLMTILVWKKYCLYGFWSLLCMSKRSIRSFTNPLFVKPLTLERFTCVSVFYLLSWRHAFVKLGEVIIIPLMWCYSL